MISKIFGDAVLSIAYGKAHCYQDCDDCRFRRFERLACPFHVNYMNLHPEEPDSVEYFRISKLINNPPFSEGKIWSLEEYQKLIPEMDASLYDFIIEDIDISLMTTGWVQDRIY